ncbi:MAG: ATP-binding protein [Fermentimonas sp.]|nr:ATP-binding protein [Fermentimonas sp.]
MRKRGHSKIKLSVILGYILVVTVMTIGLIALYNNLVDFSNKKIRNEDMSELMIVGNILSLLYEVENEQNLLTAESAKQYYFRYDSVIPEVKDNLSSLKEFTDDYRRKVQLDSISLLMEIKSANLSDISTLLDSLRQSPDIIKESESSFVPRELNRSISDYLEKKNLYRSNTAQSDTSFIAKDRKGFFDRVRDVFVANPDSTIVIENRSVTSENEFRLIVDTIINKVRYSEKLDLRKQREFHTALLRKQELMSQSNRMLSARIDELLKNIEQEELRKSLLLISEREHTLTQSQNTMLIVSLFSIVIAIFFAILFLIDINKSQRYRIQLESSNKRISDLLDYKEKLMLTISHDIKAPTGSILGFIDLMTDEKDVKKSESYLYYIKLSAEHVLQLVSRLLDFHKLDKGSWQLQESEFNLYSLIEESTNSFRPLAEKKGFSYKVENHLPENMLCFGDSYVFRQIFNNLISNAVKYTSEGGITIVAASVITDDRAVLNFIVTDTGEGIDIEDQEVVYDEFKQISNNQNGRDYVNGSGLGLAITKGFVNKLDGEIGLNSVKGEGSEFVVKIPLKTIPEDKQSEVDDNQNGNALVGLSILYIDDDPVQLKMVSEAALKKNINCITESNPDKVLSLLENNKFDILFIDIQLGGKSGFDLVDIINEKFRKQNIIIPVIALTARSDITKSVIQSAGFTDYLSKPFSFDNLYEIISRYTNYTHHNSVINENIKPKGVSALYEFVKEDTSASSAILKTFINETKQNRLILEEAFKNEDFDAAARISHKMLPLFRMIGNEKVVNIMELLENTDFVSDEDKEFLLDAVKKILDEGTDLQYALNKE